MASTGRLTKLGDLHRTQDRTSHQAKEEDRMIHYTSYKAHPTNQHIAYTKGRGKEVDRPSTMYRISMPSESP